MAKDTHGYLHGEKVAFGLLTPQVLEGQPRTVQDRVLGFAAEVGPTVDAGRKRFSQVAAGCFAENCRGCHRRERHVSQ